MFVIKLSGLEIIINCIEIRGSLDQIENAKRLIHDVIEQEKRKERLDFEKIHLSAIEPRNIIILYILPL